MKLRVWGACMFGIFNFVVEILSGAIDSIVALYNVGVLSNVNISRTHQNSNTIVIIFSIVVCSP